MANETIYGRFIIRSIKTGGQWSARALRGKTVAGDIYAGPTEEAAIEAVKNAINAGSADQRAARSADGYPTAAEVRQALSAIPVTDSQRAMLKAHLLAPGNIMTATELANAGGYDSYASANSQYGLLGRKLAEELEWNPPTFNGVPVWTYAVAIGADGETRADMEEMGFAEWRWKLRDEVIAALDN